MRMKTLDDQIMDIELTNLYDHQYYIFINSSSSCISSNLDCICCMQSEKWGRVSDTNKAAEAVKCCKDVISLGLKCRICQSGFNSEENTEKSNCRRGIYCVVIKYFVL